MMIDCSKCNENKELVAVVHGEQVCGECYDMVFQSIILMAEKFIKDVESKHTVVDIDEISDALFIGYRKVTEAKSNNSNYLNLS